MGVVVVNCCTGCKETHCIFAGVVNQLYTKRISITLFTQSGSRSLSAHRRLMAHRPRFRKAMQCGRTCVILPHNAHQRVKPRNTRWYGFKHAPIAAPPPPVSPDDFHNIEVKFGGFTCQNNERPLAHPSKELMIHVDHLGIFRRAIELSINGLFTMNLMRSCRRAGKELF